MAKKRDPRATTRRNARGEMYCPVPKAAPVKVPAAKPKRRPPVPRLMPDQYGIAT
jgi:hypothetical protein